MLKTPLMNCVDGSTDAVSIYAPAAGLLHALARCEEQLNAEFANGASRVLPRRICCAPMPRAAVRCRTICLSACRTTRPMSA